MQDIGCFGAVADFVCLLGLAFQFLEQLVVALPGLLHRGNPIYARIEKRGNVFRCGSLLDGFFKLYYLLAPLIRSFVLLLPSPPFCRLLPWRYGVLWLARFDYLLALQGWRPHEFCILAYWLLPEPDICSRHICVGHDIEGLDSQQIDLVSMVLDVEFYFSALPSSSDSDPFAWVSLSKTTAFPPSLT